MTSRAYMRGGSWLSLQYSARSANRSGYNPYLWYEHIGFRVLCATEKKTRVMRGGSWIYNRVIARADYHRFIFPGYRLVNIGFRVLRPSYR